MFGQVLLRGDLASQCPSPFQSCRALSADQTVLGQAFVLAGLLSERESRFGPCRSLPPCQSVFPPVSLCLVHSFFHASVCLSVTSAFLFLSCLSLSLSCHLFSSSLTSHPSSCPLSLSFSLSLHTYAHTSLQQHQSNTSA